MKIRIKDNSIRYRLSRSEVDELAEKGTLKASTEFAAAVLSYAIRKTDDAQLSASFENNQITLFVPSAMIQNWASTNQVGIDHRMTLPSGNELFLLLEKDFKCIDALEDQSDYFENPHLTC